MRILMVSHGYPPTISGVSLVVQKVARSMVRKGHEVTLVTASDHGEPYRDQDEGVNLIRVRSMNNPFWEEGPVPIVSRNDMKEIAAAFQPDILHLHDAFLLAVQSLRMSKDRGLPNVSTCYYVPRFVAQYLSWNDEPQPLVEDLTWTYSTWLFNQFDHVVFATKAHLNAFLQAGLEVPTTIISNGIDTWRYRPIDEEDDGADLLETLPPRPRILFVGRLAQDKEIEVLIKAMAEIRKEQPAHLLLVGRGDHRPKLEDLVHKLELQDCVHFLGFVPEEHMPALYRASDLFSIVSTCEVQSLPTLQAVATGLPVVSADAMALPELVHNGKNGFLVPPQQPATTAQAILRLLRNPELRQRMGQASLTIAHPHEETHTFDRYEELYRSIVASWTGRERPAAPEDLLKEPCPTEGTSLLVVKQPPSVPER